MPTSPEHTGAPLGTGTTATPATGRTDAVTGSRAVPEVRREELVEKLHGHHVADPYRWLEAPASDPDIRAFVASQQAATDAHLTGLPLRRDFREQLAALWDHPRRSVPWRRGSRWFQLRNDGLQDQDLLWSAPAAVDDPSGVAPDDEGWSVLLDPNGWSEDGTASLTGLAVTDDGAALVFGRSDAGSDWVTWRVLRTSSGELLPDTVPWSKFAPAAWLPSGDAFLYAAYDPPEPGQEHAAAVRDQRIQLHRLGTDPTEDVVVHARPDQPEWGFAPAVSHDGRWLLLTIHRGTDPTSRLHVAPLEGDTIGEVRPLLDDDDASYDPLGVLDDEVLVVTDRDAPLGRVIAVALDDASRQREVVAEGTDRLEGANLVGAATRDDAGWLVCRRLHHATSTLDVHDPRSGQHRTSLPLPGPVSVSQATGGRHQDTLHVAVESFTAPTRIVRCDLGAGTATAIPGTTTDGAATGGGVTDGAAADGTSAEPQLIVEQVHVHHEGVAVPLFVVHRADVVPDGTRATVLWGYGGFGIPVTPMYRPGWRAWVDAGGVLAVACLRGGSEYGQAWHDDGRLGNKQHVFDDALACAAWLTGRRRDEVHATALTEGADPDAVWSAPRHLGIEGRSNGGLLAGACITQAPEAFGTAVPEVGVLDLTRFHRFTIGWAWTSDYGSPDEADDLAVLLGYSPYHRLVPGTPYPATLITTGDTDDRVVPAHSYKFAAAMQHAQGGHAPVLLRIDTSAGHGAGKPVAKVLDERADVLAFHAHHLGLSPPRNG
jgi:prolyl oligopeptidase